ncbi:MAG: hypothetical protein JWP92_2093 [Caulobacter sp.]|nr:hypothetical protein [Caulobacter sp.]
MDRITKSALVAATLSLIAGSAFAQASATQTTTGAAKIIQPIVLTLGTGLAFGSVVRPGSGSGSVTINETSGARVVSGGVVGLTSTTSRAAYTVAGEGGETFSITVPSSFNLTGPSTIAVSLVSTATSGTISGSLGSAGSASFGVGGSLPVASSTPTGAYSGTFDVTVAYN